MTTDKELTNSDLARMNIDDMNLVLLHKVVEQLNRLLDENPDDRDLQPIARRALKTVELVIAPAVNQAMKR